MSSNPETAAAAAPASAPAQTAEPAAPAAQPEPVAETKVEEPAAPTPSAPEAPVTPPTPLISLFSELLEILREADHGEMWGIVLKDSSDIPTSIVLEKFLRANAHDVAKAKTQLTDALKWRKEINPTKLLEEVAHDKAKFGELGFVTKYEKPDGKGSEIITWNVYGTVKDNKETFGDVEEFIRWRAALMELSISTLNLPAATTPIPDGGEDPYRMIQVHDYLDVSFLRMDPNIRAASKATIAALSLAYPELLKEKFFVNVPLIMGWVFAALKLFVSAETVRKFHPLSYGSNLAGEIKDVGEQLPKVYGGKGKDLKEVGDVVKYADVGKPAE